MIYRLSFRCSKLNWTILFISRHIRSWTGISFFFCNSWTTRCSKSFIFLLTINRFFNCLWNFILSWTNSIAISDETWSSFCSNYPTSKFLICLRMMVLTRTWCFIIWLHKWTWICSVTHTDTSVTSCWRFPVILSRPRNNIF